MPISDSFSKIYKNIGGRLLRKDTEETTLKDDIITYGTSSIVSATAGAVSVIGGIASVGFGVAMLPIAAPFVEVAPRFVQAITSNRINNGLEAIKNGAVEFGYHGLYSLVATPLRVCYYNLYLGERLDEIVTNERVFDSAAVVPNPTAQVVQRANFNNIEIPQGDNLQDVERNSDQPINYSSAETVVEQFQAQQLVNSPRTRDPNEVGR